MDSEPRLFREVETDRSKWRGVFTAFFILAAFMMGLLMAPKVACSDSLDAAFERHVEAETKRLCKYKTECALAGPYHAPRCERVLVCRKA